MSRTRQASPAIRVPFLLVSLFISCAQSCPLNGTIGDYPEYGGDSSGTVHVGEASDGTGITVTYVLNNVQEGRLYASITKYQGYYGNASDVSGNVTITQVDDASIGIYYNLSNLIPNDSGAMSIHEGTSCSNVGDDYYYPTVNSSDPWDSAPQYTADSVGNASGYFTIDSGYSYANNTGHAFVVYDGNDTSIGCGILNALTFGLHIHEGTTCSDASEVGDHYYQENITQNSDPWINATYTPDGTGSASGFYVIESGYPCDDNEGHAFVVHGISAVRIGCGLLEELGANSSSSSSNSDSGDSDSDDGGGGDSSTLVVALGALFGSLMLLAIAGMAYATYMAPEQVALREAGKAKEKGYSTFGIEKEGETL